MSEVHIFSALEGTLLYMEFNGVGKRYDFFSSEGREGFTILKELDVTDCKPAHKGNLDNVLRTILNGGSISSMGIDETQIFIEAKLAEQNGEVI